jgi:ribosomal protein S18 acetylase RimI-like enzyme
MPLDVRIATPSEHEAVGRLTLHAYVASGILTEEDFYAEHLVDAAGRAADGEVYVADLDGVVVGTVTFCPEGSPLRELAGPGEAEFRMLAVSPSARRRGVAEALVRRVVERAHELGCTAVVLSSQPVQEDAHRLYERLGFHRTPDKDWSPAPGIDLLGFRLPL